ncbi:MAG: phage holin family protein [Paracoccus sp. (in: a-proteobacteria)]|nr:phage holin family protein [Paracoccus sp. (in: a-proteobacteria)]
MLDYANRMQLAIGDTVRRTGMKAGAGVVIAIGAGFLLAGLWTFLAHHLGWGSMWASVAIGAIFVLIGVVVIMMASKVRHEVPPASDLGKEVTARLNLAADTAIDKVKTGASDAFRSAEDSVSRVIDRAGSTVNRLADTTEAKMQSFKNETLIPAARSVGLTEENYEAAKDSVHRAAQHKAAPAVGLIGAFGAGLAIASQLQQWRRRDEVDYDDLALYEDDLYLDIYDDDLPDDGSFTRR